MVTADGPAREGLPLTGIRVVDEHSLYFDSLNRSKRSVCLDFYSEEGRSILDRLIAGADVLVENFTLGTLDKLGLTREHLHDLNPRLVIGSVTGFGRTGPLRDDAGLDQVIQGMSGRRRSRRWEWSWRRRATTDRRCRSCAGR